MKINEAIIYGKSKDTELIIYIDSDNKLRLKKRGVVIKEILRVTAPRLESGEWVSYIKFYSDKTGLLIAQPVTGEIWIASALSNCIEKEGRELHSVTHEETMCVPRKYGTPFDVPKKNGDRIMCAYKYLNN